MIFIEYLLYQCTAPPFPQREFKGIPIKIEFKFSKSDTLVKKIPEVFSDEHDL